MSRAVRFAPLTLLLLVVAGLVWRLSTPADTRVRSRLEGQPVPAFDLAAPLPQKPAFSSRDLAGGQPRHLRGEPDENSRRQQGGQAARATRRVSIRASRQGHLRYLEH